jgi:hypothetical protein
MRSDEKDEGLFLATDVQEMNERFAVILGRRKPISYPSTTPLILDDDDIPEFDR